jgi:hypothetical protein
MVLRTCALVALLTIGCAESPISPSPAPPPIQAPVSTDLAGTWLGRMTFTFDGKTGQWLDTRVTLTREGQTVGGDWVVTAPDGNDIRGTLSGALDGAGFAGTATWDSPAGFGTERCRGRASFQGNATTPPLRWQSEGFTLENCTTGPTAITWILNKP